LGRAQRPANWQAARGAHGDKITSVVFGLIDGAPVIISGSWDNTVRRWERFTLATATDEHADNLVEFPYDWRLSNQLNAQRLSEKVIPILARWRQSTKNPNAKLIFICHSMGGLVARYFLEVLKGRELANKLITIGTPYQGSINAFEMLVNGLVLRFGPIGVSVDRLVDSFPSAYQLLPSYNCLDVGDGKQRDLSGSDLPDVRPN
jgi:Lecithin:cholesterol acyltransferase